MLDMKTFHQLLFAPSKRPDAYLEKLKAFTKVSSAQLIAMTSGLDWQAW